MNVPQCSVQITLEDWEYAWACHVGVERHNVRLGSGDAAHYDPARMEDNLTASRAAACVEMATAKWKNLYWSGHVWPVADHDQFKDLPDVEPNIEVRRIREPHNPVAIRRRDRDADRLIVCGWPDPDEDYQVVYLIGEISARAGWAQGMPSEYDPRGTRLALQAFLEHYGPFRKR